MKRRNFIKTAGVLAAASLLDTKLFGKEAIFVSKAIEGKPNILFIMTDQQSFNMMSCMGNKWLSTPYMDSIAKNGYSFNRNYCVNPVCMPSRFSLLTGHYASEVGVKENTYNVDKKKANEIATDYSMGNVFRNAGYQTLYSGKIHLYATKELIEYGFTLNNEEPYNGPAMYAEKILPEIAKDKNAKPFLLFLSFMNPHDICGKAGMGKRYENELPEKVKKTTDHYLEIKKSMSRDEYLRQVPPAVPNTAPITGEVPGMVEMDIDSRDWNEEERGLYSWMYHRLTESVDAEIGRALNALKKSGLEENTIIIFTSDHGEMNYAHKLILKNVMFEEAQRVPLIFSGKGIKSNFVDDTTLTCNGMDLMPTLCDLAGIRIPGNLTGISLKPYLTGQGKKPSRKYIITESYNSFQITDGRYKYTIYELEGNPELLTDLKVNQGETINFANDPNYSKIMTEMKKELLANLDKRGLLPLSQNRTIKNLRNLEKQLNPNKAKKDKSEEELN